MEEIILQFWTYFYSMSHTVYTRSTYHIRLGHHTATNSPKSALPIPQAGFIVSHAHEIKLWRLKWRALLMSKKMTAICIGCRIGITAFQVSVTSRMISIFNTVSVRYFRHPTIIGCVMEAIVEWSYPGWLVSCHFWAQIQGTYNRYYWKFFKRGMSLNRH